MTIVGSIIATIIAIFLSIFITRSINNQVGGEPSDIADIVRNVADGNLNIDFDHRVSFGIYDSMKTMVIKLTDIAKGVIIGSEQIVNSSHQLSVGNDNLSKRTEFQASAIEETLSAMEEKNSTIKTNTSNTILVDRLSQEALEKTNEGSVSINKMIETMKEINTHSNKISDIIEVMNNIAFQTNLLALNASIEAARARSPRERLRSCSN